MYKSLLEKFFTGKQLEILKTRMWWVADQNKPFLVKFAIEGEFALIQLTDLRSLWVARMHVKALLEDKIRYAKSLEIKGNKDLLILLESLLSTSDSDAQYFFKEAKDNQINFTFNKRIKIYDFNWTFRLQRTDCNPVQLICKEMLSPLATVLEAQTKRIITLKRKFQLVEKDYIRKMTEMEKNLYKSPLLQEEQDWQKLVPPFHGKLLTFYKPDKASQFFFGNYSSKEKKEEKQVLIVPSARKYKEEVNRMSHQHFDFDPVFNQDIQYQVDRESKKKNLDFI